MRFIVPALLATGLALATPALAAPHGSDPHAAPTHAPAGHGDHAPAGHGAADHGGHAAAGDHGAEGGHGGGHHYLYTADSDGDGTPNWMDSTDHDAANEHYPLMGIASHAFNLLLFLAVVGYFGRKPIGDALASRALAIRKELTDSARSRDEARQRTQELGQRLDNIEAEVAQLREKAQLEAASEEAALVARAEAEAERITEAAERSVRDEVARARFALKRDAVNLAVELAEASLKERMSADQQQRLTRDFLETIKADGENRV